MDTEVKGRKKVVSIKDVKAGEELARIGVFEIEIKEESG